MNINQQKFFLYARKSTKGIRIAEIFVEKKSAKVPGRKNFNQMLEKIERGEASEILSWHPDRLARNSVDGGKIIFLLDTGKLTSLRFPQFWLESTPQGKFMLNIAFGQSKYYNDVRTKTIVINTKQTKEVQQAFKLYAKNNSTLEDISMFLAKKGFLSRNDKPFKRDKITFMLSNPFYYGHFKYAGEIHEGKHKPIISKKLFDRVQEVLKQRGRPRRKEKIPKAFLGLLKCGECGMMITREKQKGHIYYRCTKKSKTIKCDQPYIREENLDNQLSNIMQTISLRRDWASWMSDKLEQKEKESAQSHQVFVQDKQKSIDGLNLKLARLLDAYLEQTIEREIYCDKKSEFMSTKKTLQEQIINLEQKQMSWLEPMRDWIKTAVTVGKVADSNDLFTKKFLLSQITGSNIELKNKKARLNRLENPVFAACKAANQKFKKIQIQKNFNKQVCFLTAFENKNSICPILVGPQGIEP